MAWVVLVKGANVGGNVFRPSELAKRVPRLGLKSVGAAGTFVVTSRASASEVRAAFRDILPFEATVMVVAGTAALQILRADPAGSEPRAAGVRKFLTVADRPLSDQVPLPLAVPGGGAWEVKVLAIDGPMAVGVRRRLGPRLIYPNEVIERAFEVEATTRWWETVESVGELLSAPPPLAPRPARRRS